MILAAAQYLDDETILNLLPFLTIDQVKEIMKRREKEESERYRSYEQEEENEEDDETRNNSEFRIGGKNP